MKVARFVLKIVGACLAVAAAVCCAIAYWDKITECARTLADKFHTAKPVPAEYDDYADWDE